MNEHRPTRTVSLFRNGRNQAIRIPVEFELPGTEATITRDGNRLIIEARAPSTKTFDELLGELVPVPDFPDVDDGDLPPARDISLE